MHLFKMFNVMAPAEVNSAYNSGRLASRPTGKNVRVLIGYDFDVVDFDNHASYLAMEYSSGTLAHSPQKVEAFGKSGAISK